MAIAPPLGANSRNRNETDTLGERLSSGASQNRKTSTSTSLRATLALGALLPLHAFGWTITATGVIDRDNGQGDNAALFGAYGASLLGDTYTETITTDPLLNSTISCDTISCRGTAGGTPAVYPAGGPGAPYVVTLTVNGVSFTEQSTTPGFNSSYLIDALSINDTSTTLQDQIYQSITHVDSACTGSCQTYILATSLSKPLVPNLDFNQTILATGADLDAGSNTYFTYNGGTLQGTTFYGTIDALSLNAPPVPLPSGVWLLLSGVGGLGFFGRKRIAA